MTNHRIWAYQPETNSVKLSTAELPQLGTGQVLVENKAIGINPVDWKFVNANPLNWKENHIAGVDGAGVIIAVGSGLSDSLVGQRVTYHTSLLSDGSFAENTILESGRWMTIPNEMSFELAASLPCPMLTAFQAFDKVPPRAGFNVLVVGFGAVNNIVAQLLSASGFTVDVLSASIDDEYARSIGIQNIYREQKDVPDGYYAIFDAVSGTNAAHIASRLRANGHIVCIQDRINTPVDEPFTRAISYHELALGALHSFGDKQDWNYLMHNGNALLKKIVDGSLKTAPITTFKFEELPAALKHSEETKQKTVLSLR